MRTRNLTFLSCVFCLLCSFVCAQEPVPLEPGKIVERKIIGGFKHIYRINLEAGQFLYVSAWTYTLYSHIAELHGPAGEKIAEGFHNGLETRILIVAKESGEYRLALRLSASLTPVIVYRIKIVAQRQASDIDRKLVVAEELIANARKSPKEKPQQATEKYQQALAVLIELATSLGKQANKRELATTLTQIAMIQNTLGNFARANDYFNQSNPAIPLLLLHGPRASVVVKAPASSR